MALLTSAAAAHAEPVAVQLYAAGSLRSSLTEIARQFEVATGKRVALTFGASGLLRERIERGETAEVFASADVEHPRRLAEGGQWETPTVFARNLMCAVVAPAIDETPETLLATMLRDDVRVGTSTPRADPSGDYAWALFRRADAVHPGSFAVLDRKALKLTGAADSPQPPAGISTYAWIMSEGKADVFLTYCTNAQAARVEVPRLKVIGMPRDLQVAASYGMTVRRGADRAAAEFAAYLLSAPAQATLQRYGFGAPEVR